MNCKQETLVVNEQKPPFGAEISTDIYLWTISLSVSRNEEYSESAAREIKTVSFEELIRSMDKYQSIFWNQMHAGYCVCYPLNISQRARFCKLKNTITRIFPNLSWGIFRHAMCF